MEQVSCFSNTELWYPYSKPGVASEHQGAAEDQGDPANYFADCPNSSRPDGLTFGL
jgi:hypothetical protein